MDLLPRFDDNDTDGDVFGGDDLGGDLADFCRALDDLAIRQIVNPTLPDGVEKVELLGGHRSLNELTEIDLDAGDPFAHLG